MLSSSNSFKIHSKKIACCLLLLYGQTFLWEVSCVYYCIKITLRDSNFSVECHLFGILTGIHLKQLLLNWAAHNCCRRNFLLDYSNIIYHLFFRLVCKNVIESFLENFPLQPTTVSSTYSVLYCFHYNTILIYQTISFLKADNNDSYKNTVQWNWVDSLKSLYVLLILFILRFSCIGAVTRYSYFDCKNGSYIDTEL